MSSPIGTHSTISANGKSHLVEGVDEMLRAMPKEEQEKVRLGVLGYADRTF